MTRLLNPDEIRYRFLQLGLEPRRADIEVVALLGATTEALAEYAWDHMMGEPAETSVDQIQELLDLVHWRSATSSQCPPKAAAVRALQRMPEPESTVVLHLPLADHPENVTCPRCKEVIG